MLLGFILGGMLEDNLRRALVINDGSLRLPVGAPHHPRLHGDHP